MPLVSAFFILHYFGVQVCRILFVVVEARIETGGWTPEPRVSRASIDPSPGAPGTTLNEKVALNL